MTREIKRRALFLEPSPDLTLLVIGIMARPPERIAIAVIVENKNILVDSSRAPLTTEDISLSNESTSSAPIRTKRGQRRDC